MHVILNQFSYRATGLVTSHADFQQPEYANLLLGQVLYLVEILEAVGFNQQQGRLVCLYRVSSSFEVRA